MRDLFETMTCPHCCGTGQVLAHAPTSRASDPDTSKAAGRRHQTDVRILKKGTKRYAVLEAMVGNPMMTAQEVALLLHGESDSLGDIEGTRRRVSDLARAGYVADSGRRRENPGSGTKAIVWQVTLMGAFAFEKARA